MITKIITSAVFDSAAVDAKVISFEYNLYQDDGREDEDYLGGYAINSLEVGKVHVHQSTCDAYCSPEGAQYAATMIPLVVSGTTIKTDLVLTAVSTAKTETAGGKTRHTEYYVVT